MFICQMQIILTSAPTGLRIVKINSTFDQSQIVFPNERMCLQVGVVFPTISILNLSVLDIDLCCCSDYWS